MTEPGSTLEAGRRACPSCGEAMQRGRFEHRAAGEVEIDVCLDCRGIWFDAYESAQLAPAGVVSLFRMVQAARERPERPLGTRLACPACRNALAFTHDVQGTTRFTYFRCEGGDGRFTPFLQFLREKAFVRSLSPAEMGRLRATVQQVRCTSCGATVDVGNAAACPYCGAPFAILDSDAIEHALERFGAQERERTPVPRPAQILEALTGPNAARPRQAYISDSSFGILDLVGDVIDLILPGDLHP